MILLTHCRGNNCKVSMMDSAVSRYSQEHFGKELCLDCQTVEKDKSQKLDVSKLDIDLTGDFN